MPDSERFFINSPVFDTYIICAAVLNGIISFIGYYAQKKVEEKNRRLKPILIFLIACLVEMALLAISIFFPYDQQAVVDSQGTVNNQKIDGNLKLSFFDGKFSYSTPDSIYEDENDIVNPQYCSYFSDPITSSVYITILDANDAVIYDGKSEHMESILIDMSYGKYELMASCDGYQKYIEDITLTPQNKYNNIWNHSIHFIPDTEIAHNLTIQVVDVDGHPMSNSELEIGYPGFALHDKTDDMGVLENQFTLGEGEYLINYYSEKELHGRFYVNELTEDNSIVVVSLLPS